MQQGGTPRPAPGAQQARSNCNNGAVKVSRGLQPSMGEDVLPSPLARLALKLVVNTTIFRVPASSTCLFMRTNVIVSRKILTQKPSTRVRSLNCDLLRLCIIYMKYARNRERPRGVTKWYKKQLKRLRCSRRAVVANQQSSINSGRSSM